MNKPWSFYSGFLARTSSGFLQTSHRGIFSIPRMASRGDFAPQEFLMLTDAEQEPCRASGNGAWIRKKESPERDDLVRIFENGPDVQPAIVVDQWNFFEKWLKNEHCLKMFCPEFLQTIFIVKRPPESV